MSKILVSGLINIETTLKIEQFPINYFPVTYPFHGIQTTVSGVGFNLAKALAILGSQINFLSLIGTDLYERTIFEELQTLGIDHQFILPQLSQTAQSVILYDNQGQRQIHTDLKDIQEQSYPLELFEQANVDCEICALCNINFNRHLLKLAKDKDLMIATDVHAIQHKDDSFNRDFMAAADILFLSHENLNLKPQEFIPQLWDSYQNNIIVIGMGEQGAMLGLKLEKSILHIPAIQLRPIVNTIGAGDALFSSFIFTYNKTSDPITSLQHAILFASHKIGCNGAANGFIPFAELTNLFSHYQNELYPRVIKS
ncbi:MAG TPA: carbohydrate kinase family protein [Anaerolineaceae bacterium]|nr:carbohydrate kinase family protein [Anaerolineaceae bacterium]